MFFGLFFQKNIWSIQDNDNPAELHRLYVMREKLKNVDID